MTLLLVSTLDNGKEITQEMPVPRDCKTELQLRAWAAQLIRGAGQSGIVESDEDTITLIPAHRIVRLKITIPKIIHGVH